MYLFSNNLRTKTLNLQNLESCNLIYNGEKLLHSNSIATVPKKHLFNAGSHRNTNTSSHNNNIEKEFIIFC